MKNKTKDNFMGFHIPKVEKILEEHFAVISLKHKPLISEECCVLFVQYVFYKSPGPKNFSSHEYLWRYRCEILFHFQLHVTF